MEVQRLYAAVRNALDASRFTGAGWQRHRCGEDQGVRKVDLDLSTCRTALAHFCTPPVCACGQIGPRPRSSRIGDVLVIRRKPAQQNGRGWRAALQYDLHGTFRDAVLTGGRQYHSVSRQTSCIQHFQGACRVTAILIRNTPTVAP